MRTAFWVILVILVYLGFEFGAFWYRAKHLPDLPVPDQSDKTLGNGPTLRYIAAGDSITVGTGASETARTYPYGVLLELSKSNQVVYRNIAVGGFKTGDVLNKQIQQIIDFKPDIVTISIGGNDATHLIPVGQIIKNYKEIINRLEQGTTAKIYISDIPNFNGARLLPWFYIKLLEYRTKQINPELLKLNTSRTTIINIHDFGDYAAPHPTGVFAGDNFHPNDKGYQNWAQAFLAKITAQ